MKTHILPPKLLMLLCIGIPVCSLAQIDEINVVNEFHIVPSPDVYGLAKYGALPVNETTGITQIEIPLFSIEQNGFSLPISLSYHAGGFRVDESASRIGLGWSLNAGGVISRSVRGIADETPDKGYNSKYSWLSEVRGLPYIQNTLDEIAKGTTDGEPDVWFFNFNGRAGAFFINPENGSPYTMPHQDLLIEYGNNFSDFKITDENGIQYFFTAQERTAVRQRSPYGSRNMLAGEDEYKLDAWFLTSIVLPDKSTITFTYTQPETIVTPGGLHESKIDPLLLYCMGEPNDYNEAAIRLGDFAQIDQKQLVYKSNTQRIASINYDGGSVIFNYDANPRLDINTDVALRAVLLRNKKNGIVRKYSLVQNYVVKSGDDGNNSSRRMMLRQVVEESFDNVQNKPYVFEYNDANDNSILAAPGTPSQDMWGFYNGEHSTIDEPGSVPDHLEVPSLLMRYDYTYDDPTAGHHDDYIPGTARYVDQSGTYIQALMLKKMIYPGGGYSEFEFENNTFFGKLPNRNQPNPLTQFGPGLRIKKISTHDGMGNTSYRHYKYNVQYNPDGTTNSSNESSGILMEVPLNKSDVLITMDINYTFDGVNIEHCNNRVVLRRTNPQTLFPLTLSNSIYYRQVQSYLSDDVNGTNNNGRTVSFYDANTTETYQAFDGTHTPIGPEYYWLKPGWRGGNLLKSLIIDKNGRIIQSKEYVYNNGGEPTEKKYLLGITAVLWSNISNHNSYTWEPYYLYSVWNKLTSIITKTYGTDPGNNISLTETRTLEYGSPIHLMPTAESVTRSDGSIIKSNYKRPSDYGSFTPTNAPAIAIQQMQVKHIHAPVIEMYVEKDDPGAGNARIIGAALKTYSYSPNHDIIEPAKEFSLKKGIPTSSGSFTTSGISYGALQFSNDYILQNEYKACNDYGKPQELNGRISKSAQISDPNNLNLTLAAAQNAVYDDIAYCGFEWYEFSDQTYTSVQNQSNWQITASTTSFSNDAFAGFKSIALGTNNSFTTSLQTSSSFNGNKKYKLTVWAKNGVPNVTRNGSTVSNMLLQTVDGWSLYEYVFNGGYPLQISGNCLIDELKLAPADAAMVTNVYLPLVGKVSESDENNSYTHYEYDSFRRLIKVYDHSRNIIKRYDYVQQEQQN